MSMETPEMPETREALYTMKTTNAQTRTPLQKLAEAIRQGGERFRRLTHHYSHDPGDGQGIQYCAVGGAMYALDDEGFDESVGKMCHALGFTKVETTDIAATAFNPITGEEDSLFSIIYRLNDKEGWTPAQIADWLEQHEGSISYERAG